ncbi:hypothetical protein LCGC14_2406580 [marine sediment metagenome]|uniref:Uncharacterized protein n=1 Tax=marine sediment metagenome TaxID=412755 RepID=A0A0F9BTS6_9ZZZZ
MELNVKEQTEKLQGELAQATRQLQQVDNQMAQLQQAKNNQVAVILKKQGALELLQSLSAEKPEKK